MTHTAILAKYCALFFLHHDGTRERNGKRQKSEEMSCSGTLRLCMFLPNLAESAKVSKNTIAVFIQRKF